MSVDHLKCIRNEQTSFSESYVSGRLTLTPRMQAKVTHQHGRIFLNCRNFVNLRKSRSRRRRRHRDFGGFDVDFRIIVGGFGVGRPP